MSGQSISFVDLTSVPFSDRSVVLDSRKKGYIAVGTNILVSLWLATCCLIAGLKASTQINPQDAVFECFEGRCQLICTRNYKKHVFCCDELLSQSWNVQRKNTHLCCPTQLPLQPQFLAEPPVHGHLSVFIIFHSLKWKCNR